MAKMVSDKTRAALEIDKRASTLQLLFRCARLANERAMARVNEEAGRPVLRASHTALLPHLDYDGVRVVDLARKLCISKQAVSQTLAELVTEGIVELASDPSDGRAKRARLTRRGAEAITHGLGVLRTVERELASQVGDAKMHALHDALSALERVLSPSP